MKNVWEAHAKSPESVQDCHTTLSKPATSKAYSQQEYSQDDDSMQIPKQPIKETFGEPYVLLYYQTEMIHWNVLKNVDQAHQASYH